jgi:hypothetical protein
MNIEARPVGTLAGGVVLFAKRLEHLAAFYRAVTGLAEVQRESDHVVLECDGFQLVVQAVPEQVAARIAIGEPPRVREDCALKPVFVVDSIVRARLAAEAAGGRLHESGREWAFRGWRVCDGWDPEGNVFQLRERAR